MLVVVTTITIVFIACIIVVNIMSAIRIAVMIHSLMGIIVLLICSCYQTSRFGIVGSGFFNPKPQTPTLNPKPKTYPTLHPFGVEGVEFTAGPCLRCFLCAGTSHQQKPG